MRNERVAFLQKPASFQQEMTEWVYRLEIVSCGIVHAQLVARWDRLDELLEVSVDRYKLVT